MLRSVIDQMEQNRRMFIRLNNLLEENWHDKKYKSFYDRHINRMYSGSPFWGAIAAKNQSLDQSKKRIDSFLKVADDCLNKVEHLIR